MLCWLGGMSLEATVAMLGLVLMREGAQAVIDMGACRAAVWMSASSHRGMHKLGLCFYLFVFKEFQVGLGAVLFFPCYCTSYGEDP